MICAVLPAGQTSGLATVVSSPAAGRLPALAMIVTSPGPEAVDQAGCGASGPEPLHQVRKSLT
jgi:hypothetical protein